MRNHTMDLNFPEPRVACHAPRRGASPAWKLAARAATRGVGREQPGRWRGRSGPRVRPGEGAMLRCGAVRCGAVRYGALRCAALRCAALRCAALRCAALQRFVAPRGAVQCHSNPACRSIQYHVMPCHVMTCHTVACHGISWHSIAWHGMACSIV